MHILKQLVTTIMNIFASVGMNISMFKKSKSPRQRMLMVGGILILLILCIGGYHMFSSKAQTSIKNMSIAVQVQSVQKKDLLKNVSLVGQTVPKTQVDISAKYQGKITNVYVSLGQQVTAGQPLISEDTSDVDWTIDQNQHAYNQAVADAQTTQVQLNANYDKARADYDTAMHSYQRNQQVFDVGGISQDALETSRQQMEDARASLDAIANQMNGGTASSVISAQESAAKAESTISAAQNQKNDMDMISSINGIVGYRQVEAGNMVSAGQKLLSIYDNSTIYVDYQVSEQDLPAFSMGMPINVMIESLGQTIKGNIIYISPAIDSSTLTYTIRVAIDNTKGILKAGMFARALIKSVIRPQVIAVPKGAVVNKNGKHYVYVVSDNNTVSQKEIAIGASGDDDVEILSGLSIGDMIAVNNLARLHQGAKISPLQGDSNSDSTISD